jgi:hypothetical protein
MIRRRQWFKTALAAVGVFGASRSEGLLAAPPELTLPDDVPTQAFDFESGSLEGWTTVNGRWVVEEMPGAPSGTKALVQRATEQEFNVIVAPSSYTAVDVSMRFKPISGRQDASGGVVFRFAEGRYYVVRANALEDNFRLYTYDRGRRQIATATVKAPTLGQWHTVRLVAVGDHMQAWLDGVLHLDHHDRRFTAGRVGLWTKADSITAFDDVTIRGKAG